MNKIYKKKALKAVESIAKTGKKPTNKQAAEVRAICPELFKIVADKFGTAERSARNRASFPMVSDEEWKLLPYCEREFRGNLFPYIGGHGTHPMTSVLTMEEAQAYYKRQRGSEKSRTDKAIRTPVKSSVNLEDYISIADYRELHKRLDDKIKELSIALTVLQSHKLEYEYKRLLNGEPLPVKTVRKAKKVYDLYRVTSKDKSRMFINGIYHDPETKTAVATDGRVMALSKACYDSNSEGMIISRENTPIEAQFPKWSRVIPLRENLKEASVSFETLKDTLKKSENIRKLVKKISRSSVFQVEIDGSFFNVDYIKELVDFQEANGGKLLVNKDCCKASVLFIGDYDKPDAMFVMMPMNTDAEKTLCDGVYTTPVEKLDDEKLVKILCPAGFEERRKLNRLTDKDMKAMEDVETVKKFYELQETK